DLRRTVDTILGEMRETASFDVVEATTEIAFDMRYQKQTHTIRVSIPRNFIDHHTALAEAFSQQHERINGFVFDSDDIVVDSVRVTVTRAGHPAPLSDAAEKTAARAHGNGTRQVWFPEVGFVET